jgi:phosphohistidine phosphatase
MFLYILRHGDAKPKHKDPGRGLSLDGRQEVEAVSRVFSRLNPQIDAIWHSGKTRAEQTADILAAHLRKKDRVEAHPGLDPNDPVQPLVEEIGQRDSNLVIVGHLPYLGKLISVLILGKEQNLLDLPSAALVCLENSNGTWILDWFLTPELC